MFLIGLQKLGKGDWRGIARNYVITRTPTQVASHAQKYFIRQSNSNRRKRRSSLFDMAPDMVCPSCFLSPTCSTQLREHTIRHKYGFPCCHLLTHAYLKPECSENIKGTYSLYDTFLVFCVCSDKVMHFSYGSNVLVFATQKKNSFVD